MQCDNAVYLDHAAATPVRREVLDKVLPVLCHFHGSTEGSHAVARRTALLINEAKSAVLGCLGGSGGSLTFTDGSAQAGVLAILGLALSKGLSGHLIITDDADESVKSAAQLLQTLGFRLTSLPLDSDGALCPLSLEKSLEADTVLVSLPLINRFNGALHPFQELVERLDARGICTHLEAGLGCAVIDLELDCWGAHAVTLSSHLVGGPHGVAAVWTRSDVELRYPHTPSENLASIRGFAQALCYLSDERADLVACFHNLRNEFARLLSLALPDFNLSHTNGHPGIVAIACDDLQCRELVYQLDRLGVCVAQTPHGLRFSFARSTTGAELERAVLALVRATRATAVSAKADAA